ncbi:hypothetical protein SCA6_008485 [Theobroma cacao]
MGTRERERDRELLIPVATISENGGSKSSVPIVSPTVTSSHGREKGIGEEELCCVYVPTNHLYLGDIFLISSRDILRPNLSVREGIEIVISGGMSVPKILTTVDAPGIPAARVVNFEAAV